MAAILKFRRDAGVPSLYISEPFWNETDTTLNIGLGDGGGGLSNDHITLVNLNYTNLGDIQFTGDVTAWNGIFSGSVDIDGDLYVGGNVTVGNGGDDTIIINAPFSGSLIPDTDNAYDLGSPAKQWRYVYAYSASFDYVEANNVPWTGITGKPTVVSGSSQIDHDATTNYVADKHINHSTLGITAGLGLEGGGILTTTRTLTLATGSVYFVDGVTNILDDLNVISGSSQLDGTTIDNLTLTNVSATGSFSGSFYGDGSNLTGVTSYTDADTRNVLYTDNVFSGSFVSGPGITLNQTDQILEISASIGDSVIDRLTAIGGEATMSLSQELDTTYKYQIFTNGVLQQEGAGKDYTLTTITGSHTTIHFETNLIATDFVDTYYNDTDTSDGSGGGGTGLQNIVEDLSPQLGGTLDGLTNDIINITNMTATTYYGDGSNLTGVATTLPTGLVSSSIQIDHDATTNYVAGEHFLQSAISITESQISDLSHTVIPDGTISGSSQLDGTTINDLSGSFSGSFQGDGSGLTGVGQDIPDGTVSGSIQVDHNLTTNYSASRHFEQSDISITESQISDLTHTVIPDGTVSGSDQVSGSFVNIDGDTMTGDLNLPSNRVNANNFVVGTFVHSSYAFSSKDSGDLVIIDSTKDARFLFGEGTGTDQWGGMLWNRTNNSLYIGNTAGVSAGTMRFDVNDNVGISKHAVDGFKLDVSGIIRSDAAISASQFVKDGGTSNEFLLADGSTTTSATGSLPSGVISGSEQLDGSTLVNMTVSGSFSGSFQGDGTEIENISDASQVGFKQNNYELARDLRFNYKDGKFQENIITELDDTLLGGFHGFRYVEKHKSIYGISRTSAGDIYRFSDTSDLTTYTTASLAVTNYESGDQVIYSPEMDKLYVVMCDREYSESNFKVWEIDPITLSKTLVIDYDTTLTVGYPTFNIIGTDLFIANAYYSGKIHKFDLTDYSFVAASTALGASSSPHAIVTDGDKLYITSIWDYGGTYIVRMNPSDLAVEETETFNIEGSNAGGGFTDDIVLVGDYLYAPSEQHDNTGLWKIEKSNLSNKTRFDVVKTSPSSSLWTCYFDGVNIWYAGDDKMFGKFNPNTLESYDYEVPFSSSINEISSDGQTLFVAGFDSYPVSGSGYIGKLTPPQTVRKKRVFKPDGTILYDTDYESGTVQQITFTDIAVSGSVSIQSSTIQYQENLDVDTSIARIIATVPTGSADAVFFDYLVNNGSDYRAGTIMSVHDGTGVTYTDNSTSDIGDTSDVTLSVDLDGNNVRLMALVLSDNWIIKTLIRTI